MYGTRKLHNNLPLVPCLKYINKINIFIFASESGLLSWYSDELTNRDIMAKLSAVSRL